MPQFDLDSLVKNVVRTELMKRSHCFDYGRQMLKALPGLKVKDIYFNASGLIAEIEDMNASESEERYYRMTLQVIDKPSKG